MGKLKGLVCDNVGVGLVEVTPVEGAFEDCPKNTRLDVDSRNYATNVPLAPW